MRARGQDMAPLPMLVTSSEMVRIMPTAVDVLDSIGRQGALLVHLMMASQTSQLAGEHGLLGAESAYRRSGAGDQGAQHW